MAQGRNSRKNDCPDLSCTIVGRSVRPPLELYPIPEDLVTALQIYLKISYNNITSKCRDYLEFLHSLKDITKIGMENYHVMFLLFLHIEKYYSELEMSKHNLDNHEIHKLPDFRQFRIDILNLDCENPFINVEDVAHITNEKDELHYSEAKVIDVTSTSIIVYLFSAKFIHHFNSEQRFKIKFEPSNWNIKCYQYALYSISNSYLWTVIYPTTKPPSIEPETDYDWFNKTVGQNKLQKQAVTNIVNKMAYPAPYILFGPPGTGKTTTLVEAICQIWRNSKNVLICAPSNAAVDEIVLRLIKYIPSKDIYRLYAASRKSNTIHRDIRPSANLVEDEILFLPKAVIATKKIVITTLVSSMRLLTLRFRSNHFSYIIIDEAGQAIEPEALIPLAVAERKPIDNVDERKVRCQLVLGGDPYQLGPIVRSQLIKHILEKSMLERLIEDREPYQKNIYGEYDARYITKLIDNFRSHSEILTISNKLFYEGDLKSCGGPDINRAINWQHLPNKQFPLIFCSIDGHEQREVNMSIYNCEEISAIIKYLDILVDKNLGKRKLLAKDIGIVTPYKEQYSKIKSELEKRNKWRNIAVGTVETFQGQEKDVIILSTVRTDFVGFLSNPKRFNVAITRAKSLLIVLGNEKVLNRDKHWRLLVKHCTDNGAYVKYQSTSKPVNARLVQRLQNPSNSTCIDVVTQGIKNLNISNRQVETLVFPTRQELSFSYPLRKENAMKIYNEIEGNGVSIKKECFNEINSSGMKNGKIISSPITGNILDKTETELVCTSSMSTVPRVTVTGMGNTSNRMEKDTASISTSTGNISYGRIMSTDNTLGEKKEYEAKLVRLYESRHKYLEDLYRYNRTDLSESSPRDSWTMCLII